MILWFICQKYILHSLKIQRFINGNMKTKQCRISGWGILIMNISHEHNFYYGRSRNLWRGIMARYCAVLNFLNFTLHFIWSTSMMSWRYNISLCSLQIVDFWNMIDSIRHYLLHELDLRMCHHFSEITNWYTYLTKI